MTKKPVDISFDDFCDALEKLTKEILPEVQKGELSSITSETITNGNRIQLLVVKIQEDDNAA